MRVKKEDEINNFAQIKFVFASKLMTWTSWLLVEGYYCKISRFPPYLTTLLNKILKYSAKHYTLSPTKTKQKEHK